MARTIEMTGNKRFPMGFYVQTLTRMLGAPGDFFGEFPDKLDFRQPSGFLIISSLFFTGASLTQIHESFILIAGILLINAIAMPFITAGIGFMVMTMTLGKRVNFAKFYAVYAYATGVTLLASWIPLFVWVTEPWKWLLIAMGLVKSCGLRWMQAILIIGFSIFVIILFFWSLTPVISYIRGTT